MRVLLNAAILSFLAAVAMGGEPVALRAESFTVPPSTGPVTHVAVRNLLTTPYEGTVRLKLPKGWKTNPAERAVSLKPGETKRVPFAVEGGTDRAANAYAVETSATGAGAAVVRKQQAVCASAPYGEPKINGRLGDWEGAIPVTFTVRGRKTVVRTLWNKRQFCLAVEVDEAKHLTWRAKGAGKFDAIQFAIAPASARTGEKGTDVSMRCEFLLAGASGLFARDKVFALAKPGMPLAVTQEPRPLAPLVAKNAHVVVRRRGETTIYECAVEASELPSIRMTVGKEIRFSLLVHDPDDTGLRDWGQAAGLWPSQRNPLAWSQWEGMEWDKEAPFDSKTEWGLCSSKY